MSVANTLGRIFSAIWTGADGLRKILHLLLLLFIFSVIVSALSSSAPGLPASAALLIQPSGRLVEQLAGDPYDRAVARLLGEEDPQTLVQDIIDGLAYAKDDARITSVLLDLSGMPGGGLSKLKRIGDAIDDFRLSGKSVVATADYYTQGSYYLASHADEVYLHPQGALLLYGLGVYLNYYKEAIDTLKIDWNVFRVGTYKSAVEPFLRDDMSTDDKRALTAALDQLWSGYQADIEKARELEPGTIGAVLEDLVENVRAVDGDLARLALERGLVDGLLTRQDLRNRMVEIAGVNGEDSEYPVAYLEDYLKQMRLLHRRAKTEKNVAIVVAAGEILNGIQSPGMIGGDSTAELLREARQDESVSAVVLRVDSPGGSSFASEVIRNEVEAIRAAGKPVVVSMGSVAASGGYWVSMDADRIYATPYTITGSIGIFGMFPTFQRSLDAIGISTDGIGTTPWAGELRADRKMSDEMKAMFQLTIENGYDEFITGVAKGRDLDKDYVNSIAQGRIWTGSDALDIGLVDELGNLDEAIAAAAALAGLEPASYGQRVIEQELDPGEQLLLDLLGGAHALGLDFSRMLTPRPAVARVADAVEEALSPLTRFNDPKGIYSHCFCAFE